MKIKIIAVGGTIDKVYFDKKSTYEVGEPQIEEILNNANVTFEYDLEPMIAKDSLDMTDEDRELIRKKIVEECREYHNFVITHGTDTMVNTAQYLKDLKNQTVVLTGSMQPARFKNSDATFNIGCAIAASQSLSSGVYIVMNGRIFNPFKVKKNVKAGLFESVE